MKNLSFISTSSNPDYTFHTFSMSENKIKCEFFKEKIYEMDNLELNTKHKSPFYTFGIAMNDENLYVSSHAKIGIFNSKNYDYIGLVEGLSCGLITHQILLYDNLLYISNTSNDSLGIFDLETNKNKYVLLKSDISDGFDVVDKVEFPDNFDEIDNLHFNALCKYGDSIFVLLSMKGKGSSKVIELSSKDYQPINLIDNFGNFNHDLLVTGDKIYSISSNTGEFVEYDRNSNTFQRYSITPYPNDWWARGFKKIENSMYIFIGEHQNSFKNIPFTIVKEFDLIEKKIISTNLIPLKGNIYQVI